MVLGMSLIDTKTKNVLAVETIGSMQDIELETSSINLEDDMLTYIEIPNIDAGMYEIQILVVKGLFLPTKKFETCLVFDFVIEYVTRPRSIESSPSYQVLSVFPTNSNSLRKTKGKKIEVKFDRDVNLDDLIEQETDIEKICYLKETKVNNENPRVLYPYKNLQKPANTF